MCYLRISGPYPEQLRRKRLRATLKDSPPLELQADRFWSKSSTAAIDLWVRNRALRMLASPRAEKKQDRAGKSNFSCTATCGKKPLVPRNLFKSFGSVEILTIVNLAIEKSSDIVVIGQKTVSVRRPCWEISREKKTLRLGCQNKIVDKVVAVSPHSTQHHI